jgi:dTDP-glucose 4,6-dehydratase
MDRGRPQGARWLKRGEHVNLLVTGGAGFIGSHFVRLAVEQPAVERLIVLDALTYAGHRENLAGIPPDRFTFEQVDLNDAPEIARVVRDHAVTHVVHLAAESHVDRSIAEPRHFIHSNVVGTHHLLEACRAAWGNGFEGRRLLHVSTDEVYGSLGATGHFTEGSTLAPNSPYAATKGAADLLVRASHHTHGLPVITTRCSNNYGPFQFPEKLIPVVILCAQRGEPIPVYGDGLQVRDWIHVQDHARALWLLLQRGRMGEIYNIGARNEWTNLRLVERLCDLVDELLGRPAGTARRLISFVADRPGHDRRYALDSSKVERELGWTPAIDFASGLLETVRWFLNQGSWVTAVTRRDCK